VAWLEDSAASAATAVALWAAELFCMQAAFGAAPIGVYLALQ
jgi:hypothetical protein